MPGRRSRNHIPRPRRQSSPARLSPLVVPPQPSRREVPAAGPEVPTADREAIPPSGKGSWTNLRTLAREPADREAVRRCRSFKERCLRSRIHVASPAVVPRIVDHEERTLLAAAGIRTFNPPAGPSDTRPGTAARLTGPGGTTRPEGAALPFLHKGGPISLRADGAANQCPKQTTPPELDAAAVAASGQPDRPVSCVARPATRARFLEFSFRARVGAGSGHEQGICDRCSPGILQGWK